MLLHEPIDAQGLLDQFWSDCYLNPEDYRPHRAVQNLLTSFRKTLDSASKTATAIDLDDPLDEIIRCAEKEGYMEIAQLLSI